MTAERKKKAKAQNYTQKTLKALRGLGYEAAVAERWIPFYEKNYVTGKTERGAGGVRKDLFDFIDIVAMRPDVGIVGIQSTGPTGHSQHRRTIMACDNAKLWLKCRGRIALWSWKKVIVTKKDGTKGKAGRWKYRQEEITLKTFEENK